MNQDKADDPNLADLKKLLRRLEKIDPEGSEDAEARDPAGSASEKAKKLQRAVAGATSESDGLLTLQSRTPGRELEVVSSPELPVIVKTSPAPVKVERATDPPASGTLRTVLIASVTATIVSALAAAGTFYWLRETQSTQLAAPTTLSEAAGDAAAPAPALKSGAVAETAAAVGVVGPAADPPAARAAPADTLSVPQPRPATQDNFAPAAGGDNADGTTMADPPAVASRDPDTTTLSPAASMDADTAEAGNSAAGQSSAAEQQAANDAAAADTAAATAAAGTPPRAPAEPDLPAPSNAATVVAEAEEVAAAKPPADPAGEVVAMLEPPAASREAGTGDEASRSGSNGLDLPPSNEAAEVAEPAAAAHPSLRAVPVFAGGSIRHPAEMDLPVGEPIALPFKIADDAPDLTGHYLIVSGLKRGARFNAGIEILYDTWRLDLSDLRDLQLTIPEGFARRLHVAVDVRRPDGTSRENSTMIVNLPARSLELAPASSEGDLPDAVRKRVDEAEVHIDNGNLRTARLLFERGASEGSARAALLLAATYDPAHAGSFETLPRSEPDLTRARQWYQRAADLGSQAAVERLKNLPPS